MPFIVAVTSQLAAERAAAVLRREGFPARTGCQGASAVVVVTCLKDDADLIVRRIRCTDDSATLVNAP